MLQLRYHRWLRWLILAGIVALILALPRRLLIRRYQGLIFTPENAPPSEVAIVFGAGLRRDGSPTAVLADRVATAARLYQQGKVQRLLLSGSRRPPGYDETAAMLKLALHLGVPRQAISLDPQGDRTFNTCLRARQAFAVQRAALVTQAFHLPRSLAICQALGMQVAGVQADGSPYSPRARRFWEARETLATLVALWDTLRARWLNLS